MPLRPYDQDQMFLLPPSLNEWVRHDHPARVFSEVIERIETGMFRDVKEEGRPAYHPKMMLKVLLWGYATGVRSSRKIEEKLQQDVVFMWLGGMERPDFRTLCLFRTGNKEAMEQVFAEVLTIAREIGMERLGLVALDGSKVQASSSIESFKSISQWRNKLLEAKKEAQRIIDEAERIDKEEEAGYGTAARGDELPEGLEKAEARIRKIEELLKRARQGGKGESAKMSLTDPEASFMHRRTTSIPAYNAQLGVTEDHLIVYAEVTTEPIDVNQVKNAVEGIEREVGEPPAVLVADAGYCGGENLRYLEDKTIDAYIPEQGERQIGKAKRARPHLYGKESFTYYGETDRYVCPQGEEMRPTARARVSGPYHKREVTVYRTKRGICAGCPRRQQCTPNEKLGRAITRDGYEGYRDRMRAKLITERGRTLYGKRKCIVEPVIGQIKTRGGFSQFLLRGIQKARIEWKIGAIAHNLLKVAGAVAKREREILTLA
ncbi:MAG TPA: IS1182 family transposase [Thermodesulfovibrionales bacterium]|nr:IS1182 family transposase [Thermodesulfovibrionales bacterium]